MKTLFKFWRKFEQRKSRRQAIKHCEQLLIDRLDPDYGLLGNLRSRNVLTPQEVDRIKAEPTFRDRNSRLISCVLGGGRIKEFVDALRETGQSHIANYLESGGIYSERHGNDWPLTDQYISILDANKESLVDLLDLSGSGLLQSLYSRKVLNQRQRDTLSSIRVQFEANDLFLDLLRRRSVADYLATIDCLHATNQSHIAKTLQDGGAIVSVHSGITTGTAEEVDEAESRISSICHLILRKLPETTVEETQRILDDVRLKVIAVKKGNSVVFYVLCRVLKDLERLELLLSSGRMNVIVETLIIKVYPTFKHVKVTSYLSEKDLNKAKQFFKGQTVKQTSLIESWNDETEINDLPLELLDIILLKSYLHSATREIKTERRIVQTKDEDRPIIERLTSVDSFWFQRFIRRRFKISVWAQLSKYFHRTKRLAAFYRENYQCIEELMEPNQLTKSLASEGLLSAVETVCCTRKKRRLAVDKSGKGSRHVPLSSTNPLRFEIFSEPEHDVFVRRLRQTGSTSMAKFLEDGGVAVKVEIRNSSSTNRKLWIQRFVKRLNSIEDKDQPRLASVLKESDVKVLKAVEDREAIVWMWCKSVSALDALQRTDLLNGLTDNLRKVVEDRYAVSRQSDVNIHVDEHQFRRQLVLLSSTVYFIARLDLEEKCLVYGVTKLNSSIYVVCREIFSSFALPSPTMYIFEDQSPFNLKERIELKEILCPLDIASDSQQNCLYVLDSWIDGNNCLWKIVEVGGGDYGAGGGGGRRPDVSMWLDFEESFNPVTLSVSGDGQALMVSWRRDDGGQPAVLRFYGPDSEPLLALLLPQDIRDPGHAVKTSTGSFIIIHRILKDADAGNDRTETRADELRKETASGDEQKKEQTGISASPVLDQEEAEANIRASESVVSEVSGDGAIVLRRFLPMNEEQKLNFSLYYNGGYFCVDSRGRLFVSDTWNHRVIVLDSDLMWTRILIPSKGKTMGNGGKDGRAMVWRPWKLFYDEQKRQAIIGGGREVDVCNFE